MVLSQGDLADLITQQNEPSGSCIDEKKNSESDDEWTDYIGVCQDNQQRILDDSCTGQLSCSTNTGPIGLGSCKGMSSCQTNKKTILDGSCLGGSSCYENDGNIGAASCSGTAACFQNKANIGGGSCNSGVDADPACTKNTKDIGEFLQYI